MAENKIENLLPQISYIEENVFYFVKKEALRTNLAIALQYIYFLVSKEEKELPGPVVYSNYKSIIVHTAAIAESLLHYCLHILIDAGKIKPKEVMPREEKLKDIKVLYRIDDSDDKVVIGAIMEKTPETLKGNTNFISINRACKKADILDDELFKIVEDLREKRNRIHLTTLDKVDDFYTKENVQNTLDTATRVIRRVEALLALDKE